MPTMRIWLTLVPIVCLLALLGNARARASRATRKAVRAALVVLALASFALAYGDALLETTRAPYGRPDAWGLFHYYLGAKYFTELDYASFYACVVSADADGLRVWVAEARVRDLSSYAIVARDDVAPCPRARFSPARWREFVRDVATLQAILPETQRPHVLTDKGFNPPPSWAVAAGWLANRVHLDRIGLATVAFNLDVAFGLASLVAIALVLDAGSACLAAIFLFLYFGSFGRIAGTFLQYAWLPALTGAFLAWLAGRYRQSAAWWALATLLQTFPLALVGGIALRWAWLVTRARRDREGVRASSVFLAHYAAWLAAGFGATCLALHGIEPWQQWAHKIGVHGRYLVGEVFDIGLRNLMATILSSGVARASTYAEDAPNVAVRLAAFASYEWLWYLVAGATLAYIGWRMRHVNTAGVVALGYVLMYVFLDLSPYYYTSLTLLFVLFPLTDERHGLIVQGGLFALLAYHAAQMPTGYITFQWSDHLVSELLIAAFMSALLMVATRPRRVDAQRAAPAPTRRTASRGAASRR